MSARGFTLLEVLIALAILAIALAAAVRASGGTVDSTLVLKQRVLAQWVAQNRMAEEVAQRAWPEIGSQDGEASQAGERFKWRETISETAEPRFRRIEIQVFSPTDENHAMAQLNGLLSNEKVEGQ